MLPNGPRRTHVFLAIAVLLAAPALAGCIGTQTSQDTTSATSPQGEKIEPSDATKALWEKGHKDPYVDVEPTGDVHEVDLWVNGTTIEPVEGEEILGVGFTTDPDEPAQVPAPEIRVTQGDTVRVRLHSDHHTIHWHGIDVPWTSDGVPFLTQDLDSGGAEDPVYTYEFVATQAGTYWYHCAVGFPSHKDLGMFGPLIVEKPEDERDLPYDRDETLMFHELDSQYTIGLETALLQDPPSRERLAENPVDLADSAKRNARQLTDQAGLIAESETGVETFSEGPRPYYPLDSWRYRPNYDTFMINGKAYPETEPVEVGEGETLRLRMVNAGQQTRAIHLHGHHMLVTHRDGYPLSSPEWRDVVTVSAGQHVDAYVQGTNPGIWNLHDHAGNSEVGSYETTDYAFPGGMRTQLVYENFDPPGDLPSPEEGATAGELQAHAPSYEGR